MKSSVFLRNQGNTKLRHTAKYGMVWWPGTYQITYHTIYTIPRSHTNISNIYKKFGVAYIISLVSLFETSSP